MAPTCELQAKRVHKVQTVVIKVASASVDVLKTHCNSYLWNGAGAVAHVEIEAGEHQGQYIVLTSPKMYEESAYEERLKKELLELPGQPRAEWVKPLTRRLQRLFRWGDVAATRADVVRATKAGDVQELQAILPKAPLAEQDDLSAVPALFDAIRGNAPALADCEHDFYRLTSVDDAREKVEELKQRALAAGQPFDENRMLVWLTRPEVGRCSRDRAHFSPFWRCTLCRLVLCDTCTHGVRREQQDRAEVERLRARCAAAPEDGVRCEWRQHPERPLPFFVIDQKKVADDEKVVWIRQELGSGATLPEFSRKYIELFGERKVGAAQQKAACLKLYALYRPDAEAAAWKIESDIPPPGWRHFSAVWGDTRDICDEGGKVSEPGEEHPLRARGNHFCSQACKTAGVVSQCKRCTPQQTCSLCRTVAASARKRRVETAFTEQIDAFLVENEKELKHMREALGHTASSLDPAHEPAWKRRRRS